MERWYYPYVISIDTRRLENVSESKYFGHVLDDSGTDEVERGKKVAGAIRLLMNNRRMCKDDV